MVQVQSFYQGDEVKFSIDLQAPGFSTDDDNFEIEVTSKGGGRVKASKNAPSADNALIIFNETPEAETGTWYAILDTTNLKVGTLNVIATAHVPDANANDGIRRQTDKQKLGELFSR